MLKFVHIEKGVTMNLYKLLAYFFTLLVIISINGCGGSSSSSTTSATGSVSVLLTDAPGDYEAVYVTIDEILVHKAGDDDLNVTDDDLNVTEADLNATDDDPSWITVAEPHKTYDLLTLQNGITELLGESNISAGRYTQMRLVLGSEDDNGTTVADGYPSHPFANYIVFLDGGDVSELDVPSNVFKTNHNFEIIQGESYTMLIDFDANQSINQAGNSGRWILNPVIGIETTIDEP